MEKKQSFSAQLKKADSLFDAGKIEEALAIFQKLHQQQPTNVKVYLGMAQCLAELDEIDDALDILDIILTEFPNLAIAILFKAQYLSEADGVQEAIQFLEDKINSGFSDPEGYALLGELYLGEGKFSPAINAINKALKFPSLMDRRSASINLANCYAEISNDKKAIEIYENLLSNNPDDVDVLFNKALLLKDKNDSPECLKILLRLTSLNPEFLEAWILLGSLYEEMGANDKAQECVDKINELTARQNK